MFQLLKLMILTNCAQEKLAFCTRHFKCIFDDFDLLGEL